MGCKFVSVTNKRSHMGFWFVSNRWPWMA